MNLLWRNPALPVGVVLLLLGMGNWLVSRNKILEYTERIGSRSPIESVAAHAEFPELNAQTNAALLERLHRGLMDSTFADAKLDFYQVVHSGGLAFAYTGLLLIGIALLRGWRERRARTAHAVRVAPE